MTGNVCPHKISIAIEPGPVQLAHPRPRLDGYLRDLSSFVAMQVKIQQTESSRFPPHPVSRLVRSVRIRKSASAQPRTILSRKEPS
jgi:hypothetical protein